MNKKLKCCVCHKEINEEEAMVFKNQIAHSGECLRSIIDKYNTNRRLEIENKRLKAEIEKLNNIINKAIEYCENNNEYTPRLIDVIDILKGETDGSNK